MAAKKRKQSTRDVRVTVRLGAEDVKRLKWFTANFGDTPSEVLRWCLYFADETYPYK